MKHLMLLLVFFVVGCAHNIKISPERTLATATVVKSKKVAAVYISDADKSLVSKTNGGGGDKISYTLAKDMEYEFFLMVSDYYDTVKTTNTHYDANAMKQESIAILFEPKFTSSSSGSSIIVWPADQFSITIQCKVVDSSGKLLLDKEVTGEGHATNSEVTSDFALAANRAAKDVMQKLRHEIEQSALIK